MISKNIYIIGAGQLGSRHLQALKNVSQKLSITVIDPNQQSLGTAKQRFLVMLGKSDKHEVRYLTNLDNTKEVVDIAIVATNADVRSYAIQTLITQKKVKHLILEKLLFQKKSDYHKIEKLLKERGAKAWVNCSMRNMPFYFNLKKEFKGKPIYYIVSGSLYGLVTNAIHYLDYITFLTGCSNFEIDTSMLDIKPISSKRKGFLELTGTLEAKFKNRALAQITCFAQGDAPVQTLIFNRHFQCISRETQSRAWLSSAKDNWKLKEIDSKIPYQSQATTWLVEDILKTGDCKLVPYQESVKVHLQLLEPLRKFLNQNSKSKYNYYPFT